MPDPKVTEHQRLIGQGACAVLHDEAHRPRYVHEPDGVGPLGSRIDQTFATIARGTVARRAPGR